MRFLIDECMSPQNVAVANEAGFEAYHVAHRGWSGEPDAAILGRILEEELILVTNNRDDFLELVAGVELHPGLIVLVDNVRRDDQRRLLRLAIERCKELGSCINRVIEVELDETITVYDLPVL